MLLPNGTVLVTGGQDGGSNVLSSAEVYDPVAGTFTALTGTLNTARTGAAATELPDGTVLVVGGSNSSSLALANAEIYSPVAGTFTALTGTLNTARTGATATLFYNGTAWKVLVAGGQNSSGTLNSMEIYDPISQTFTAIGDTLSGGRAGHTATLLSTGTILFAGGSGLASAEIYDPNAHTSIPTGSMTVDRTNHGAAPLPDGNVLIAGGTSSGNAMNGTELYNPAAGTFTAAAGNLSKARTGLTATLLDSALVLVVGGSNSTDGTLSSAELYTPSFDPLGTVTVASSDTNDQISGTCALALTGTGATMCTAAVMPPHVDTATHTITASYPADNVHSASDNSSQSDSKNVLTVTKGTPVIAWSAPAPIGYGTALSATQLDASASYNSSPLAGSFAYTPAAGSVLAAGTQTLSVTFTPTDNADYTTATQTVQLRVN